MEENDWSDCYALALYMFQHPDETRNSGNTNLLEKVLCDKYSTIFSYDPYTDIFSLVPDFYCERENPAAPLIRDCYYKKLERFRNSLGRVTPGVAKINLYTCVEPGYFIFYNHSQPKKEPFTLGKLEAPKNLKKACINDIFTGAELLVLYKNCGYRAIVLGQKEDQYKIMLLDFCQFCYVKLRNLYLPEPSLMTDVIPCSVFIGRLRGIKTLRKKYFPDIRDAAEKMGDKRIAINAMIYGVDADNNVIIDFEGFDNKGVTQSSVVKLTHGYEALVNDDPEEVPLQKILDHKFVAKSAEKKSNVSQNRDSLNVTTSKVSSDLNTTNGKIVVMDIPNENIVNPKKSAKPEQYDQGQEIT